MGVYELRVWGAGARTATPHRVEKFEAVDDEAAKAYMDEFAATLKAYEDVWLYRRDTRSPIASTSGSRT